MGKVSKNQRSKKPEANKTTLDKRNYQCSANGIHSLLYAESYEEALVIARSILGIKKDEAFIVKPYGSAK